MDNSEIVDLLRALSSTTASIIGINEKLDKLNDKLAGLMETIYRASQGIQEKSNEIFSH